MAAEAEDGMMKEMTAAAGIACACAGAGAAYAPGDVTHGFRVDSVKDLPDAGARMVRMTYEKNGAGLVWFDRDDDSATFAIAFRTIPGDDTGVAHIIEHSVLCGSGRYPVKEPFVDLLKGSFATFINAWTAADHTAYPVVSKNRADFLNLVDVYLDAVFDPLSVKSPLPFLQEGWHWTVDSETGELGRNGIVLSEMKGAFSSPRTVASVELDRLLYPDNAYGRVSGGDPAHIPELDYEEYRDFYFRHYHPSNARVFLDGKADVEAVLERLDRYFSKYPRRDCGTTVPLQAPRKEKKTVPYALAGGEDPSGKTILCDGWLACRFDEELKRTALQAICMAIADSNEGALSAALLEKGLCEDVAMWCEGGEQIAAHLYIENAADGKEEEIRRTVLETFRSLAAGGLDRERLLSVLARAEFEAHERDYGTTPRGLAYFGGVLDQWLYGGEPDGRFHPSATYPALRERVAQGWFERLVEECFIENPSHVELTLKPDPELAAKRSAEEKEFFAAKRKSMSAGEYEALKETAARLDAFQKRSDTPEALATLPRLKISDIPVDGSLPRYSLEKTPSGSARCAVKAGSAGIVHATVAFPLDGLSPDELADVSFGALLFGELAAGGSDVTSLKNEIDSRLGRFDVSVDVFSDLPSGGRPGAARAWLMASAAALSQNADAIPEILSKVLSKTCFRDVRRVGDMLTQKRREMEFSASGIPAMHFARTRAASSLSEAGALDECCSGIAALRRYQAVDDAFAAEGEAFCESLAALMEKVVSRGAWAVFASEDAPEGFAERLEEAFPFKSALVPSARTPPMPKRNEGFRTGGDVASAAVAAFSPRIDGASLVAARILTLDWLWNQIRVLGGAYGGSLRAALPGNCAYLSWNDPDPLRSVGIYRRSGDALRKAAEGDFSNYVVSALAATEPYLTPSGEMSRAVQFVLAGREPEFAARLRREILATDKAALLAFADEADRLAAEGAICIVGGREQVESARDVLDSIEDVAAKEAEDARR